MREAFLNPIREDLQRATTVSDYEAVEVLWVALVKLGNLLKGGDEPSRVKKLVRSLPIESILALLRDGGVNILINLDPPLEAVLSNEHERLEVAESIKVLAVIRECRETNPLACLLV